MIGRGERGGRGLIGCIGATVCLAFTALLGGAGCGGSQGSPEGAIGSPDGGESNSADGMCGAAALPADPCTAAATGTITACGQDSDGQPSQNGYLEIAAPDGSRMYTCATSWSTGGSGGYWFDQPGQFMSDPESCCGGAATPVAAPAAPNKPAAGFLGAPHAPRDIIPLDSEQPGDGLIMQDPFAVVVTQPGGATAFQAALANWNAWVGDGNAHDAPDGSGSYYFAQLLINYAIVPTSDGRPAVVVGPEVSVTADGKSPLGHPTLGVCPAGGGAPLVLMAGEVAGTILTNHSGRFGHDASVTQEALDNASKLFNCLGIPISSTTYYPPKP